MTDIYIYIYIYTHTHTHTHIYIYIYIYMCVCVCVCVCIHTHIYIHIYINMNKFDKTNKNNSFMLLIFYCFRLVLITGHHQEKKILGEKSVFLESFLKKFSKY